METVGDRVQKLLLHFDWSGAELGRQCGVKRATVSKWVANKSIPKSENLLPLRKKHRVNDQWVLYGHGEMLIQQDGAYVTEVKETEHLLDEQQRQAVLQVIRNFARKNDELKQ